MKKIRIFTAFCLTLTLLAFSSYASGFSDGDSIGTSYRDAVERMVERRVLSGFPDGSFQPEGTLTREQGAKIVAYIILGDDIGSLVCVISPFDDVDVSRWSAPCIDFCVEKGVLLGYGNGLYGPEDTLTGDQFAKMLLCALGLSRTGNYAGTGDEWYKAVRDDAGAAGLYNGDRNMASDKPISRQQAALLAWNAVSAASVSDGRDDPGLPAMVQPSPSVPSSPSSPSAPDAPEMPSAPSQPSAPDIPSVPSQPSSPDVPVQPVTQPQNPPAGNNPSGSVIELPELGGNSSGQSGSGNTSGNNDQSGSQGNTSGQTSPGGGSDDIQLPEIPVN